MSANKALRETLAKAVKKEDLVFIKPELKYTTDNAVMVACAGYFKAKRKDFIKWDKLRADCNLKLK